MTRSKTDATHQLSPLATALGELSSPGDFRLIEARPDGDGWISFSDLLASGPAIDTWLNESAARNEGRRDLAGSFTGLRIAGPAIDIAVTLFLVKGWATPLPADGLMLRLSETGGTTGVTLRDPTIIVSAEDPVAGEHVVRVADRVAVLRYIAQQIRDILTPPFEAIDARTPYRMRGLWGAAADLIAGMAARRSRARGLDQEIAWQAGVDIIDALAEIEPWVRMRPRRFVAAWPGECGTATVAVKGTCCLVFKTSKHTDDQQFCSNCPLLSDESRAPRMEQILVREYDRLRGAV